jgi:hypothetical protein
VIPQLLIAAAALAFTTAIEVVATRAIVTIRAGLDGPSVPVRVEPIRLPPPPAVPMPERERPAPPAEPAPARKPDEVPA